MKEAQRPHNVLSHSSDTDLSYCLMILSNRTPRADVRVRLIESESFKIRISQSIKSLIVHAFHHHRHSAGSNPIQRKRSFPFDWSLQLWLLYQNKHFNYWYCVLTRSSWRTLTHCLQVNIKAKISSIDRERTNVHKGFKGTWEEKNHCCLFVSYWVLLVLASRLYPRECMSNSRQSKGDFSARQVSFRQVGCVSLGRDWITQGDRRTERGPRPASSTFSPTIFRQRGKWYLGNTDLIKTTMRCHLRPARRAITKKSTNNQCWRGCGNKGALLRCWWECEWAQPLWRTVWRFLKN